MIPIIWLLFFAPTLQAEQSIRDEIPVKGLIPALKSGGYILYFRHMSTDHSQNDRNRENLGDCSFQRNLDEQGRQDARQIGEAITALKIPIGKVTSSPYCRCRDTAKLAFGDYEVDTNLAFSISKNQQEAERLGDYLYQQMLQADHGQVNTVFVGHTSNLRDGLGVWPRPEGAAAVFQLQQGKLVFRGLIKPDQWTIN